MYRDLSPGELRVIYNALDKDHNNKVTSDEWSNFHKLFVEPYEACNTNKSDYQLDCKEVANCLKGPHFVSFTEAYKDMDEIAPHIVEMLDKPQNNKINLADYVFLRRVSLSWKKCSLGKVITPLKLPCALRITSPESRVERGEATHVFELGRILNRGRNKDRAFLDLLSFLNVAHLFYYFTEFEKPMFELPIMGLVISKAQLHRVIQNQVLPSDMGNDVVEAMFNYVKPESQDIDRITFSEFGVFMYTLRLFAKHATKKFQKFFLDPKGFNSAISDPAFDHFTLQAIDSFETPTFETVKHELHANFASNSMNEEEFLISFLQKKYRRHHSLRREDSSTSTSTTTVTATTTTDGKETKTEETKTEESKKEEAPKKEEKAEEKPKEVKPKVEKPAEKPAPATDKPKEEPVFKDVLSSKSNRLIIYNSFEHKGVNEMDFLDFLRFYKLSICFYDIAGFDGLVNTSEINAGFKSCFPPMPFYPSEIDAIQTVNFLIIQMTQYLSVDKEVNMKQFLAFFNYLLVFGGQGTGLVHTSEKKLVAGIKMLGFQVTSEILDEAREGIAEGDQSSYNFAKGFIKALDTERKIVLRKRNEGSANETSLEKVLENQSGQRFVRK